MIEDGMQSAGKPLAGKVVNILRISVTMSLFVLFQNIYQTIPLHISLDRLNPLDTTLQVICSDFI